MPGRGSYGPAGKWVHDRAHRIMEESEGTPKSVAYAIATQQAHKVGKSPKSFRTPEGVRTALAKMPGPAKEYKKTAAKIPIQDGRKILRRVRKLPLRPPSMQTGLSVVEPAIVDRKSPKKQKMAMIRGLFDELEKISQAAAPAPINTTPAPGMGAQSPSSMGAPGAGALGGSAAPRPPDPANTISAGKAGGLSSTIG